MNRQRAGVRPGRDDERNGRTAGGCTSARRKHISMTLAATRLTLGVDLIAGPPMGRHRHPARVRRVTWVRGAVPAACAVLVLSGCAGLGAAEPGTAPATGVAPSGRVIPVGEGAEGAVADPVTHRVAVGVRNPLCPTSSTCARRPGREHAPHHRCHRRGVHGDVYWRVLAETGIDHRCVPRRRTSSGRLPPM